MAENISLPEDFARAVKNIRSIAFREELSVTEIESPQGIAEHSFALAAEVLLPSDSDQSQHGTGRFILLYDSNEPEAWGGKFRVVTFTQAPLEHEIGFDPFLAKVTWSWLEDALTVRKADYTNLAGTATRILSTGFGQLEQDGEGAQIELRASWSPQTSEMGSQAQAWGELLCMLAGLPPTSEAVSLTARRRERG